MNNRSLMSGAALAACLGLAGTSAGAAAEVHAAVAANFTAAATKIAAAFTSATGHEVVLSFGATGQLYAQIIQGAPFDVLLAADETRPAQLVASDQAVAESRFTYAVGRLVLWSADPDLVRGEATLRETGFEKLAIAEPAAAPYGAAAIETMAALGVAERLASKLVRGLNISQAFQFVASGNAELGFVALSQLAGAADGSRWLVPERLHAPIRQDAVLLAEASGNEAAAAFLTFLAGETARRIIADHGYGLVGRTPAIR